MRRPGRLAGVALAGLVAAGLAGCGTSGPVASPSAPAPVYGGPAGSAQQPGAAAGPADPSASAGVGASAAGSPSAGPGRWRPTRGLTWQWQLTGSIDTSVPAQVYDVDAVTTPAATVATLHGAGRHVICYVNVGAKEDFRPDAGAFPAAVVGGGLEGWPGEHWLDIRRWDVLQPIMTARFRSCRAKGFDGVEPDNVDAYANRSGFPLTAADQLTYDRRIADLAHTLGLAVGLKNDVDQASALQPSFDFAVDEECARYGECASLKPFIAAGKAVFHVEYDLAVADFCPATRALGFSSMKKKVALDAWREPC